MLASFTLKMIKAATEGAHAFTAGGSYTQEAMLIK
jgi:hypothetical protein